MSLREELAARLQKIEADSLPASIREMLYGKPEAPQSMWRTNKNHLALADEVIRCMEWARRIGDRTLTVGEVLEDEALIKASGINPWCVNEGLAKWEDEYGMVPLTLPPDDFKP